ncbi:polar amino acid ABC transporter, inner membrane subunit [Plautia stali symbiont]|nr:polar amino acid ABC transporter, inner membrane subunit [Plautia stali symbiont]
MTIDWQLLDFGDEGWGGVLLDAATVTVTVSLCAWLLGAMLGSLLCWMQISGGRW